MWRILVSMASAGKSANYAVPHFQVVLGGEWEHNAGSYGLPVAAVPSKNIPQGRYSAHGTIRRRPHERRDLQGFREAHRQVGNEGSAGRFRRSPPATDRSFFSDWGDPREYSLGDMGVGECAGEVVSPVDFELAAAESEVFEAQLAFDAGQVEKAGTLPITRCCTRPKRS